jgi:excisionase family DNA binding protein
LGRRGDESGNMGKVGGVMETATLEEEQLDTPRELAAALKVTPPTILDWLRREIIPAEIAVGRVYRFNRAKVRAALAAYSTKKGVEA